MIVGLGTDIVEISRIQASLERLGEAFAKRVLTPFEFAEYELSKQQAAYLAKKFAVKEAAVKALGIGIGRGISWQHCELSHDEYGAPKLSFSDGAKARSDLLAVQHIHVSISDERNYAVATVVLEK